MERYFDIGSLLRTGKIHNELEYERAKIAMRKLRLLSEESAYHENQWWKIIDILEQYQKEVWKDGEITDEKVRESDKAEQMAEKELFFINDRRDKIKARLKELNMTQQELGHVLGHKSKTHMSELMNGLTPFKLKDLIIINTLLGIDFADLIPTFLSKKEVDKVQKAISELNKPAIKFSV